VNEEVKEWIIKAYEDYITVKYLISLPEDEIITSAVCFHSQQFVEKIFKAFLVLHKVKFGRTHNLSLLKELCSRKDPSIEELEVENLNMYAVESRYPEIFLIPSLKEAQKSFKTADYVKEMMFGKLNVQEKEVINWIKELKQKSEKFLK